MDPGILTGIITAAGVVGAAIIARIHFARRGAKRILSRLRSKEYSARNKKLSLLKIFSKTAPELAVGCSSAYVGLLLQDLFEVQERGWEGLREAFGFEASEILGEFFILGLWERIDGTDAESEMYRLTDLGRNIARKTREHQ